MRLLIKIITAPIMLLLTVIVAFCTFIISVTGVIFWILSVLVFVGSVLLFFSQQIAGGIAFLVIAFLVSPYGLPALAEWLVGMLDSTKYSLREFMMN